MGKFFFDYDDDKFLYTLSDDTAMDFDGRLMMRSGDNFAMDLETGDFHFVSQWPKDDPLYDDPVADDPEDDDHLFRDDLDDFDDYEY